MDFFYGLETHRSELVSTLIVWVVFLIGVVYLLLFIRPSKPSKVGLPKLSLRVHSAVLQFHTLIHYGSGHFLGTIEYIQSATTYRVSVVMQQLFS